jgi:hypothetical protein
VHGTVESSYLRHNGRRYESKPSARHVVVDARHLSLGNSKLRLGSQRSRRIRKTGTHLIWGPVQY